MYSAGLPILYPFACVFYMVLYWVYKFLLLKYYEKTTRFNEQLPLYTTNWIKIGLILHGIVGGLMITNSNLLPPDDINKNPEEQYILAYGTFYQKMEIRFLYKPYSVIYVFFWFCVFVWMVAQATVLKVVFGVCGCICSKLIDLVSKDEENKAEAFSNDFLQEVSIQTLIDLYDKAHDELRDFKGFSDSSPNRFPEEAVSTDETHKEKLQRRIASLEAVTDDHLEELSTNLEEKAEWHKLSYPEKMQLLFEKQTDYK